MATAADLMTPDIPRSDRHRTVDETIAALQGHTWDEVRHIYLVDDQAVLTDEVPIERLLQANEQTSLASLEGFASIEVSPGDGQSPPARTDAPRGRSRHGQRPDCHRRSRHFERGNLPDDRNGLIALVMYAETKQQVHNLKVTT